MVEGVNPSKLNEVCANCGGRMQPTRNVGAYASVPCRCADCESSGTVVKNKFGMVVGNYGALRLEPVNEEVAEEISGLRPEYQ